MTGAFKTTCLAQEDREEEEEEEEEEDEDEEEREEVSVRLVALQLSSDHGVLPCLPAFSSFTGVA